MKVKKLIELLQQQNPNAIVVLQEDREGNGHSPLGSVEPDGYVAMTKWNGDRKLLALTPELEEKGYTAETVPAETAAGPPRVTAASRWPAARCGPRGEAR